SSSHSNRSLISNVISEYFGSISENDGVYDLGYSGLIHKAICDATKVKPKALFVHTDENKHVYTSRRGGFKIYTAMCGIPNISGLIRELFFSALEGSCVGYSRNDKSYVPMIEEEIRDYSDIAPIYMMQYGALQMVKDFYTIFESYIDYIDIASGDMMLPFEGMLCNPQKTDTRMFNDSWFEDKVYGRVEKINVRDFWNQLLIMRTGLKGSNISSSIDEILAKKKKKKLAIFGTGKMTEMIMLKEPNIEVSLFLDNSKAKNGTKFHNIDVLSPYECEDINSYYIVIAIGAYKEIEKQLTDMGLVKYRDFINYMEFF
ncbi:MAG: hypothetical protein Q4D29_13785, partial [Lachnospiraceae bacterium]|nr:hypothetical protein [Lachnospiraceae bacterium]